ncbi:MAG: POTRA domain-containing protein [Pseudomonadota bacterium]
MRLTPDSGVDELRIPLSQQKIPVVESPCFPVFRVTLEGDRAADFRFALAAVNHTAARRDQDSVEDSAIDPSLGRCLGAQGVNIVLARVQEAILAQGFSTTRVFVTAQNIASSQTLNITVIPGRIRPASPSPSAPAEISTNPPALPRKSSPRWAATVV